MNTQAAVIGLRAGASFATLTDTFTPAHIETLRNEWSKIQSVDPCGDAYPKLCKVLDGLTQKLLIQLSKADIRFVSGLARNRIK